MDTSLLAIAALGFFLGMRHATDPDHVIAISTIVARHQTARGAALIGGVWGLGHTLTILVVGGGIVAFRWVISPRVGLSMELTVGLMLIVLGVMNLTGFGQQVRSSREAEASLTDPSHSHADHTHDHGTGHGSVSWLDRHLGTVGLYQLVRPLIIGIVHGLAGSAAIALLVLANIKDPRWSLIYLVIFGIGTIVGMMLITTVISFAFVSTKRPFARMHRGLRLASGAISLGFGLLIAYRIGIVNGLFTGNPDWTAK
ncbi:MAG: high-affinity nickel-transport family protein [Gemmatimonadota bacterium]